MLFEIKHRNNIHSFLQNKIDETIRQVLEGWSKKHHVSILILQRNFNSIQALKKAAWNAGIEMTLVQSKQLMDSLFKEE